MLPPGVCQVVPRKLVKKLDIAGQADAHVSAFDQVMTQEPLLGESSRENPAEGVHVIDALAVVGAFTGEILVDIGYRPRVGVYSRPRRRKAG